jgi:hypothetical protein
MLVRHGVRSALEYASSGDLAKARALSNPDLSPHLSFVDVGGHGYATVRVTPDVLESEFVCIDRPIARSTTPTAARSGIASCTAPGSGSEESTRSWSSGCSRARRIYRFDDEPTMPRGAPSPAPLPHHLMIASFVISSRPASRDG